MRALAGLLLTAIALGATAQDSLSKETLQFEDRARSYYLFVPDTPPAAAVRPLLVLLHGSGRDGRSLLDPWRSFAKDAGVVLAAPESLDRAGWSLGSDGPSFLQAVIQGAAGKTKIDGRRMYLFGHSAGGHHAFDLAFLESEYFAAAAMHAGAMFGEKGQILRQATRKIPIAVWSGTADKLVPIAQVRATEKALLGLGFPVELHEMRGHTHDYYGAARDINREVWTFLATKALERDPEFRQYAFGK